VCKIGEVEIWFESILNQLGVGPRGDLRVLRYMFFQGSKLRLLAVSSCSKKRILLFLRLSIVELSGDGIKL